MTVGMFFIGAQIAKKTATPNPASTSKPESTWSQYPNPRLISEKAQGLDLNKQSSSQAQPLPSPVGQPKPSPQAQPQQSPTVKSQQPKSTSKPAQAPKKPAKLARNAPVYKPRYTIAWANSTNYGERFQKDVYGNMVNNQPIIVLHETTASASSAVNTFQKANTEDEKQVSYHTLIALDGTVIYLVPPEKRAFGAANSVFEGSNGSETVKTNPALPPSVNNFAYHVSLETPLDGWDNKNPDHSGYTEAQYQSLAWLISQSSVTDDRITTHRQVDRSRQRVDPRSFDFAKFFNILHQYRQANAVPSSEVKKATNSNMISSLNSG